MLPDAQKATIYALTGIEAVKAFQNVRTVHKGLNTRFIPVILYAGDIEEIRCIDFATVRGWERQSAYNHLRLAVQHGYMVKRDKLYSLTDLGHKVYLDAKREMEAMIKALSKEFSKRAKISAANQSKQPI
jgi:hypothetical protein